MGDHAASGKSLLGGVSTSDGAYDNTTRWVTVMGDPNASSQPRGDGPGSSNNEIQLCRYQDLVVDYDPTAG